MATLVCLHFALELASRDCNGDAAQNARRAKRGELELRRRIERYSAMSSASTAGTIKARDEKGSGENRVGISYQGASRPYRYLGSC